MTLATEGIVSAAWLGGPLVVAALVAGLAASVAQTGGVKTSLERLHPLRTLERLFSLQSVVEAPKALLKVVAAFGGLVVGGNLLIVQFLVVTNGTSRMAEVAARFALDAMLGK